MTLFSVLAPFSDHFQSPLSKAFYLLPFLSYLQFARVKEVFDPVFLGIMAPKVIFLMISCTFLYFHQFLLHVLLIIHHIGQKYKTHASKNKSIHTNVPSSYPKFPSKELHKFFDTQRLLDH